LRRLARVEKPPVRRFFGDLVNTLSNLTPACLLNPVLDRRSWVPLCYDKPRHSPFILRDYGGRLLQSCESSVP
jgi:hypothetical protein